LYISQINKKPNRVEHTWSAILNGGDQIIIHPKDPNRNSDKTFYIAVRAHKVDTEFKIAVFVETEEKKVSELRRSLRSSADRPGPGYEQCNHW
jgi:hypothetical protein